MGNKWSQHKPNLREDFHERCGYCGSYDGFKHTYFEVDHFVPRDLFVPTGAIGLCQYDNLVYSCRFCNNYKGNKWPSNDIAIHNINNEGFVDPCDKDFDNHLYRSKNGSIRWRTPLGKWMVEVGFKFDQRDIGVKLLWELDELKQKIESLMGYAKKYAEGSEQYKMLMDKVHEYASTYYLIHNELIGYYNTL